MRDSGISNRSGVIGEQAQSVRGLGLPFSYVKEGSGTATTLVEFPQTPPLCRKGPQQFQENLPGWVWRIPMLQ